MPAAPFPDGATAPVKRSSILKPIIAIDPGHTTGIAFLWSGLYKGKPIIPQVTQDTGRENAQRMLAFYLDTYRPEVVSERYAITAGTTKATPQYDALYLNGWLEATCREMGLDFTMQTPADAKGFAPDARLKRAGWYIPTLPHGRDAARHLMLYLVKHHADEPMVQALLERLADDA